MVEPTLCFSVKTGLKISAVIDLLLALLMLVVNILVFVYFEYYTEDVLKFFANTPPGLLNFVDLHYLNAIMVEILLSIGLIYWVQKIWLGYVLYRAAAEDNLERVRHWIIYTFVLLALSFLCFLASLCSSVVQPYSIPVYVGVFLVREYSIWILFRFKGQLEEGKAPLLVNANEFTNL